MTPTETERPSQRCSLRHNQDLPRRARWERNSSQSCIPVHRYRLETPSPACPAPSREAIQRRRQTHMPFPDPPTRLRSGHDTQGRPILTSGQNGRPRPQSPMLSGRRRLLVWTATAQEEARATHALVFFSQDFGQCPRTSGSIGGRLNQMFPAPENPLRILR